MAATFTQALELARKNPQFQQAVRGGKNWYAVTFPENQIRDAIDLVDLLKGWRNRQVYVNGQPQGWDSVFGFVWCYRRCEQAYKPAHYCFVGEGDTLNIAGCIHARTEWRGWADWFTFGKFVNPTTWQFDKDRIRHHLQQKLRNYRFCPHLKQNYMDTIISELPDTVTVSQQGLWTYRETYEPTPNAIKVTLKQEWGTEEVWVDGVQQRDRREALRLIATALRRCGLPSIDLKE